MRRTMVIKIPLSKRGKHAGKYETIIDDCDDDLASLRWFVHVEKHTKYALRVIRINGKQKQLPIHRIILERILERILTPREIVDHINNNGLDNRRSNLRLITYAQNNQNQRIRSNSKTGYKGVGYTPSGKYRARIFVNKKRIHLGMFDTAKLAHEAYCKAAIKYFKNYANQ